MIWCTVAERVMKDWSCERLVLVVNAFSLTVARIVGPHLGCSVDEDAVVKLNLLTEAQVALRNARVDVLKRLQYTDAHMVAVIPCMYVAQVLLSCRL